MHAMRRGNAGFEQLDDVHEGLWDPDDHLITIIRCTVMLFLGSAFGLNTIVDGLSGHAHISSAPEVPISEKLPIIVFAKIACSRMLTPRLQVQYSSRKTNQLDCRVK